MKNKNLKIVKECVIIITLILLINPYIYADDNKNYKENKSITQQFEFVIITNDTFYDYDGDWDLNKLAEWHNNNDTIRTFIVNLSTIYQNTSFWVNGTWGDNNINNPFKREDENNIINFEMFNDSAAKIRNYLRYSYYDLGVRYALLIGDTNSVGEGYFPIRYVYSRGSGAPANDMSFLTYYEIIPTDLYYACLNGTFNADEDANDDSPTTLGGWGENATECGDNIDECDWEYEIAVGRFPVDSYIELENAVMKTIKYMNLKGDEDYLDNITLAGHYAGWGGDSEWGTNYSKTVNGTKYRFWNNDFLYGFNSSLFNITVIDANPDRDEGIAYTDINARGQFNAGCHIWYQSGHGSSSGWSNAGGPGDSFSITDIESLTNTKYSLILSSIPCNTANFDNYDDCFIEKWLIDEHGAFAAIGNTRYGWGCYDGGTNGYWDGLNASSHYLLSQFLDAYFNESEGYNRIGDCLFDGKRDAQIWHDIKGDGTIRWAMYEQILFGNPAITLKIKKLGFSLDLKNKWNLISYPCNTSLPLEELIIECNGTIYNWTQATSNDNPYGEPIINRHFFGWNRSLQFYNISNSINSGFGLWCYVYKPCLLKVDNYFATSDIFITNIKKNWNIISIPHNKNISINDLLVNGIPWSDAVSSGIISDFVFTWNKDSQYYNFTETLKPGEAYWIYGYEPCIIKRML